jgi:hypothetical protein
MNLYNLISLISFALAIGCYVCSQAQQHGKLRWMNWKDDMGFLGENSDKRKYDNFRIGRIPAKVNFYTRLMGVKFKERWFTSTNLTVFLTDFYHLMQFFSFILYSLCVTLLIGFTWWTLVGIWLGVHAISFIVYKLVTR